MHMEYNVHCAVVMFINIRVVLKTLCGVAVVAIVVDQYTVIIVQSCLYDIDKINNNLDKCKICCHVVVEAYQCLWISSGHHCCEA